MAEVTGGVAQLLSVRLPTRIAFMGLYLCIFDEAQEDELGACDVGHYNDFGCFRDTIARHMGAADFPVLMTHSDCDGEWTVEELRALVRELETIAAKFRTLAPEQPKGAFEHTAEYRQGAKSLYDCFHDVNGQNLFESLITLCKRGISSERPISFQ